MKTILCGLLAVYALWVFYVAVMHIKRCRDGGTTYTTATLTNLASYDGTYSIIKARADVSAQPSGTSMLCRIKQINSKLQRVAAPALYAE